MKLRYTLATLAIAGISTAAAAAQPFSNEQVKEIQQIVHKYLVTQPQVLVEASQALQKRQMVRIEEKAKKEIAANAKQILALGPDAVSAVAGNPKGDITLVEFYDYQCPHCQQMAAIIDQLIEKNSNLRVVFKEFPIFPNSQQIAELTLSFNQAHKDHKNAFLKLHTAMMDHFAKQEKKQGREVSSKSVIEKLSDQVVTEVLKNDLKVSTAKVKIAVEKLIKAETSKAVEQEIKANYALAQKLGIGGTPAFIVMSTNSVKPNRMVFIPGAANQQQLQQAINQVKNAK